MELTFEVTLDYGDEGPDDDEATPVADDVEEFVVEGMRKSGFRSADVKAELR